MDKDKNKRPSGYSLDDILLDVDLRKKASEKTLKREPVGDIDDLLDAILGDNRNTSKGGKPQAGSEGQGQSLSGNVAYTYVKDKKPAEGEDKKPKAAMKDGDITMVSSGEPLPTVLQVNEQKEFHENSAMEQILHPISRSEETGPLMDIAALSVHKEERTKRFRAKVEAQQRIEREITGQNKTYYEDPLSNEDFKRTYTKFAQNRRSKVKNFSLDADYDEDASKEAPPETAGTMQTVEPAAPEKQEGEEYRSPKDAKDIFTSLKELKRVSRMKISILLLLSLFSLYITFANTSMYQIAPGVLLGHINPLGYSLANFIPLLLGIIICGSSVLIGLGSFLCFRSNRESLCSLLVLGTFLQSAAAVAFSVAAPEMVTGGSLYSCIGVAALFINAVAKLDIGSRAMKNFRFVAARNSEKYAVQLVEGENAENLTRGLLSEEPRVAISKRTDFLSDFMANSFAEDSSDKAARIIAPLLFLAAAAVGAYTYLQGGTIENIFAAFALTLSIGAPVSYIFAVNHPLTVAAERLYPNGAILGEKASAFAVNCNSCAVTADKLFPKDTVVLQGIKTFEGARVDEAILDAASVLYKTHSILWNVFSKILAGRKELLKEVDSVVYEDTMGISAWVNNKRVLIGSRELMRHHSIAIPSKEYEAKYVSKDAENLVYLATSGELAAIFVVGLTADDDVYDAIDDLDENDVYITVKTVDPIITTKRLGEVFDRPPEMFKILPSRFHNDYEEITKPVPSAPGEVACDNTLPAFADALVAAKKLRSTVAAGIVMMVASVLLGLGIVAFYLLTSTTILSMSIFEVLIYQSVWLIGILLVPKVKRL